MVRSNLIHFGSLCFRLNFLIISSITPSIVALGTVNSSLLKLANMTQILLPRFPVALLCACADVALSSRSIRDSARAGKIHSKQFERVLHILVQGYFLPFPTPIFLPRFVDT